MYTIEEFDKEKTKVLKYIIYKKRSEQEIRNKFRGQISEEMLEEIIEYLESNKNNVAYKAVPGSTTSTLFACSIGKEKTI